MMSNMTCGRQLIVCQRWSGTRPSLSASILTAWSRAGNDSKITSVNTERQPRISKSSFTRTQQAVTKSCTFHPAELHSPGQNTQSKHFIGALKLNSSTKPKDILVIDSPSINPQSLLSWPMRFSSLSLIISLSINPTLEPSIPNHHQAVCRLVRPVYLHLPQKKPLSNMTSCQIRFLA